MTLNIFIKFEPEHRDGAMSDSSGVASSSSGRRSRPPFRFIRVPQVHEMSLNDFLQLIRYISKLLWESRVNNTLLPSFEMFILPEQIVPFEQTYKNKQHEDVVRATEEEQASYVEDKANGDFHCEDCCGKPPLTQALRILRVSERNNQLQRIKYRNTMYFNSLNAGYFPDVISRIVNMARYFWDIESYNTHVFGVLVTIRRMYLNIYRIYIYVKMLVRELEPFELSLELIGEIALQCGYINTSTMIVDIINSPHYLVCID